MTERCKRNPCCGDLLDCKPPPQFKPRESYEDYQQRIAKPAPSPAPVRPIGNQGISDYQREIARNMAEGFAAWNAARQEALPSDEPASSPAGGGVHEAAIGLLSELDAYCVGSRAYDRRVNEARRALKAALSQSTSAGKPDGP